MTKYYTIKQLTNIATKCKNNTEKNYRIGIDPRKTYYLAEYLLNPTTSKIQRTRYGKAPHPKGTHISRQIPKTDYIQLAKQLIQFVNKNHRIPNYLTYGEYKIRTRLYTYMFSKIFLYQQEHHRLPAYVDINTKIFTKPRTSSNEVYNYFTKTFGQINSIDEALEKIAGNGRYGYYYDDRKTNHEAIDSMRKGEGVNCTDSCQVFYNILLELIRQGKYKKVECLHVKCQGGDGHVRLRITNNKGSYFYRDPAAVLDSGDITRNWCMNGQLIAIDPAWFIQNLKR